MSALSSSGSPSQLRTAGCGLRRFTRKALGMARAGGTAGHGAEPPLQPRRPLGRPLPDGARRLRCRPGERDRTHRAQPPSRGEGKGRGGEERGEGGGRKVS